MTFWESQKRKLYNLRERFQWKGQGSFFKAESGQNLDESRLDYCATKEESAQHMTSQMVKLSILKETLTIKINYYNILYPIK